METRKMQLKLVLLFVLLLCLCPSLSELSSAARNSTVASTNTAKPMKSSRPANATAQKLATNYTASLLKVANTSMAKILNSSVASKRPQNTTAPTQKLLAATAKPKNFTISAATSPQVTKQKTEVKLKQGAEKDGEGAEDSEEQLVDEEEEKELTSKKVVAQPAKSAEDKEVQTKSEAKIFNGTDYDKTEVVSNDKSSSAEEAQQKEILEQKKKALLLQATASDPTKSTGHAFVYILALGGLLFIVYILVHNKNKLLGLLLEGRSGRRPSVGRRGHATSGNVRYKRLSTSDNPTAVDVDN